MKVSLFHLPSVRMVLSSRPAIAAAVAAPILKLCPAYCDWSTLTVVNTSLSLATKQTFNRSVPWRHRRMVPGMIP